MFYSFVVKMNRQYIVRITNINAFKAITAISWVLYCFNNIRLFFKMY